MENNKTEALIELMKNSNHEFLTGSYLANTLKCSRKTVTRLIQSVNANGKVIISTNRGYKLTADASYQRTPDESSGGRKNYIIWQLLKNRTVDIFDLAEELYVSSATINKDIEDIKRKIGRHYRLKITVQKNQVQINGDEEEIRKLFAGMVRDESKGKFVTTTFLQECFPDIDVEEIRICVQSVFNRANIFVNDYQLQNIVLHVCIIVSRSICGERLASDTRNRSIRNDDFAVIYQISREILADIAAKYELEFPTDNEVYDLAVLILCNSTNKNVQAPDYYNDNQIQVRELATKILKEVRKAYGVELSSKSFINRFTIHLDGLITRAKNQRFASSTLARSTKQEFPLIFDISTYIAYLIKKETGYEINDDEISFIAIHVGSEIDEQVRKKQMLACVLICYSYNHADYHLAQKITSLFGSQIMVVEILPSEFENYDFSRIDMVISCLPVSEAEIGVPTVIVHPLLSHADVDAIRSSIKKAQDKRLLSHRFNKIFPRELFYTDFECKDKEEAIMKMADHLIQEQYADKGFGQSCLDREALSSTIYGDYAIPHPIIVSGRKTAISVAINRKGMPWGEDKVYFIFMLCVSKEDKQFFREVFSTLISVINSKNFKMNARQLNSYDEFMKCINNSTIES